MTFLRMLSGFLLQTVPFAFLCIGPFKSHLCFSKERALLWTALLLLILSFVFAGSCCYLKVVCPPGQERFIWANIVFLCSLIPCMVWYILIVRKSWQQKLFVFFFTMTGALAMTSIGTVIETKLQWNKTDGLPYYGSALLTLAILTAVVWPLLWLLIKYCYIPVCDGLSRRESGYLATLAVFLFMALAGGLVPINYENIYNPMSLFLYFTLLTAVFVIYLALFKMLFYAHENLAAQQNMTQIQHQLELRDEQYRRITDNIEHSRRLRHDIRHHLITLQGVLRSGDLEKAEEYLGQYVKQTEAYTLVRFCENPAVNVLVSYYQWAAKEKNIVFKARIDIPGGLSVSDPDISVLIGNLLENAIEGACHASEEKRYILLNLICSGKMLAMTVDNGFDGSIKTDGSGFLSTKNHHTGRGLSSMKGIAEKYNGGAEFTCEGEIFHSSVMLGLG